MKKILLLLCIAFSCTSCCKKVYQWQPKGPYNASGPVRQIVLDPNTPNKIFAATENGGVWANDDYTNAENVWYPLTDTQENLQTRGFDVFKHNDQIMAMGNGLGFIHISYDGGASWKKIEGFNFEYIRKLYFDHYTGTIPQLKVASSTGLYTINLQSFRGRSNRVEIDTMVVDTPSEEILDYFIDNNSTNGNVRFAAARNKGVFRSGNYGRDWKLVHPLPSGRMIKFGLSAEDGTVVFKQDTTLYVGTNTSAQFAAKRIPINTPGNSDLGYRNFFGGRPGDWCHAVAVDPKNSSRIISGINSYFITEDQGDSFIVNPAARNPVNWNCFHEDPQHMIFNGADILIASDGGVHVASFDSDGLRCTPLNNGFQTLQFYRVGVNNTNAAGNADHNGIWFTNTLLEDQPQWTKINGRPFGNNSLEDDFVFRDRHNRNRFYFLFRNQHLNHVDITASGTSNTARMHSNPNAGNEVRPFSRIRNNNGVFNMLNYPVKTIAQHPDSTRQLMLLATHNSAGNNGYGDTYTIKRTFDVNVTGAVPNDCGDRNGGTWCDTNTTNYSSWDVVHTNGGIPIVGLEFYGDVAYALDERGTLMASQNIVDANPVWDVVTTAPLGADENARQFIFNSFNNDIYLVSHQKIHWYIERLDTWRELSLDLSNSNKINSIAINNSILYVATDRGVYTVNPFGALKFGVQLPNAPIMQLFVENDMLYAVSFGRGLWSLDVSLR